MDTNSLVSELIDDGKRILDLLPNAGFEITAGFWLKSAEDEHWYFYIVSPAAESERLNQAYGRLMSLIRRMPEPHWIDPLEVKLIGPSNPIAIDVLAVHERAPGPKACPTNWGGRKLGNVRVEGTYLYPLPVVASN